MEFLAHIAQDGRIQTLKEHLDQTGSLSGKFAADFGAGDYGRLVGFSHDIGKSSAEFQRRLHGGPKVDHATAGAIECAKIDELLAAFCVAGHHGGLSDFGNPENGYPDDGTFVGRLKKGIKGGIPGYKWESPLPAPGSIPEFEDEFSLSLWIRMLYSCLVDADFLDTEEFMAGSSVRRWSYDPLPVLLEKLERYIAPWFPPENELNRRRCEILNNCLEAGAAPKGIYTLTVPTGGGKTVASLAFALRHAVENGMGRVIYVVPYTSIIEQNAEVFRKILGDENVLEHHSGVVFDSEDEVNSPRSLKRLAAENWDCPVIVTTAVQFFESLYSNKPSKCRKLHSIANSVIIFDEVQMLPHAHLKPCVGAIANLAAHFGATAVLCTATQPELDGLIHSFCPDINIKEICPNTAELYEHFRRVTFRSGGKMSNEKLAEEFAQQNQVLCIVNSRKAAHEIYSLLPKEGSFHLSTLMYPAHRHEVLKAVRKRLSEGLACRVVSTSLIEAGVDVDFPAVYRELAGLDSILQAAGRCNREGKRSAGESIVTFFEREAPPPRLFGPGIGAAKEALGKYKDPGSPEAMSAYFASYRELAGSSDKSMTVEHLKNGISGCRLPFETVAGNFHFIDNQTKSVYIPLEGGKELCEKLLSGTAGRDTYRKAGQYCVNIFDGHYQALFSAGDLELLDDESAVLTNSSLYSREMGLSLEADSGRENFI
ncbi:MAG: CRISPR-associated helicase Cas3' [Oscillospiraceae bacterium]